MPKLKTKSGAKKRFFQQGNGKIKHPRAFKRHLLTKKSRKSKRHLKGTTNLHSTHVKSVKQMLCI